MKINEVNQLLAVNNYKKVQKPTISKMPETQAPDSLQVSPEALSLSSALRLSRQLDPTDLSKVDSIRQQIQAGTYTVDPQDLAEKMLKRF